MKQNLNDKLNKEKVKALLTKKLLDESFYGILGIHQEATSSEMESCFREKTKGLSTSKDLSILLKAYSTLSSGYRVMYDEYLSKSIEGIEIAVEVIQLDDFSLADIMVQEALSENSVLPEGVFMQPWATSL